MSDVQAVQVVDVCANCGEESSDDIKLKNSGDMTRNQEVKTLFHRMAKGPDREKQGDYHVNISSISLVHYSWDYQLECYWTLQDQQWFAVNDDGLMIPEGHELLNDWYEDVDVYYD